jgi:hypothetical protein
MRSRRYRPLIWQNCKSHDKHGKASYEWLIVVIEEVAEYRRVMTIGEYECTETTAQEDSSDP